MHAALCPAPDRHVRGRARKAGTTYRPRPGGRRHKCGGVDVTHAASSDLCFGHEGATSSYARGRGVAWCPPALALGRLAARASETARRATEQATRPGSGCTLVRVLRGAHMDAARRTATQQCAPARARSSGRLCATAATSSLPPYGCSRRRSRGEHAASCGGWRLRQPSRTPVATRFLCARGVRRLERAPSPSSTL
jgi:hypothetical protein